MGSPENTWGRSKVLVMSSLSPSCTIWVSYSQGFSIANLELHPNLAWISSINCHAFDKLLGSVSTTAQRQVPRMPQKHRLWWFGELGMVIECLILSLFYTRSTGLCYQNSKFEFRLFFCFAKRLTKGLTRL